MFPKDLNSELKNRLKKSTHATVSNLKKSNTLDHLLHKNESDVTNLSKTTESSSESDEDGVDPDKNLAKILRSVSKENMHRFPNTQQIEKTQVHQPQHDDALHLVRNLSSLEKGVSEADLKASGYIGGTTSTSEGESSGGREITSIIKNSAVARRRKLNEG